MAGDPSSALIALFGGESPAEDAPPRYRPESQVLLDDVGPGTHVSDDFVARCHGGGVMVEVIPVGTVGSADLTVLDSGAPLAGYEAVNDAAGTVSGIAARRKLIVANVGPFVKVQLVVTTGRWSVVVTPIRAVSQATQTVDTELPAAAALSDAMANPTAPQVGAALEGYDGAQWQRIRIANIFKNLAAVAVTAGTPVAAWTPATGKKFRILGYALSLSVAGSVILKDGTTEVLRTLLMPAGDGQSSGPLGNGLISTAVNNVLNIDVTATGAVSGWIIGVEE